MDVELVEGTSNPDRTIALAARGDYMAESPWDDESDPLGGVSVDDDARDVVREEEFILDEHTPTGDEARLLSLLRRLFRRRHFGPFEHAQATFKITNCSVVTERQLTRHRHATFDVQSMRFVGMDGGEFTMPRSITDADHATRHGEVDMDDEDREAAERICECQYQRSMDVYEALQDLGVPDEDARYALPLGAEINMTMSANLRSLSHVIDLRRAADAQWEITELAEQMSAELHDWAPISAYLFEEFGPFANAP